MAVVDILVLGATYGLLPGAKLALAGHKVTLLAALTKFRRWRMAA